MALAGFVVGGGTILSSGLRIAGGSTCEHGSWKRTALPVVTKDVRRRGVIVRMQQQQQGSRSEARTKTFEVRKPLGLILEELDNGDVFIASVEAEGNAGKLGLERGDLVSGVEGRKYSGKGLDAVMSAIQGAPGEAVKLLISRTVTMNVDSKMAERLRKEVSSPYRNNWLGIAVAAVFILVILSYFSGIR